MQHILCFGDSNTWGFQCDGSRIDPAWPGIFSRSLPAPVQLTVDALPGRTATSNGAELGLTPGLSALQAHRQAGYDWLLLMLGTNELARCFGLSAREVADNVAELAAWALEQQVCRQLLLIAPPPIGRLSKPWRPYFDGRQPLSHQLVTELETKARQLQCHFASAGEWVQMAEPDGLHLDAAGQKTLGRALAKRLAELLSSAPL